jgi:hypothetical protein
MVTAMAPVGTRTSPTHVAKARPLCGGRAFVRSRGAWWVWGFAVS